ncbi:hypothetical protein [Acinetobacter sp. WCHAc060007]|uniref:hypothetical protein n=1 Tax=Acinetobacter sp. WCHAc060007 TaxID=2419605 RepID=UPI000EA280DE|nr:hypothetical protein [Acinetobacter sp. WCHAc060007]RKG37882.1 hypothetical protein D7V31_16025 [Acinetobacter sp. WCHAc060007]
MNKRNLEEKIKDVGFWTVIFFILYLIVGYLLESLWLSKPLKLNELYDLLKDGLGITAAFLAPVAAFLLFSDWREQHNKQVRNEFALKVFRQFEVFEKTIQEISLIYIEMDNLVPEESRNKNDGKHRPIYLNDKIFEDHNDLILSFFNKIREIQEVFNILLDDIRYFGIVANKLEEIAGIANYLIVKFEEVSVSDEESDSYTEYLQLLEINASKVNEYYKLRDDVSRLIITSLLMTLKAD